MSMLSTVCRNLFGGPATLMYPVKPREPVARARGHVEFNEALCNQCGTCARRCPAVAIDLNKEKKEWILHPDRCIICEVCAEVCPKDAITIAAKWRAPFTSREAIVMHSRAVKEKGGAE
jgi:ech hydrogenase subunit F